MAKRTVLIVDDQMINRRILRRLLQAQYNVLEAADGLEALTVLRDQADVISAVLLDIVMPVLDGYAVLETMAKEPELRRIPVLVSSQKDGDEAEIRVLSLGAQDFVAKPYKGEIILHRLSNTIRLRETAALVNRVERDELTGLYNKQFFQENLRELLRQHPEQKYDLVCFGIERFKLINETYGMEKGDELLRHIAQQLQGVKDVLLAARFSGDLFYLLLHHRESYDSNQFAQWFAQINQFPIDMDIKLHCGIYLIHNLQVPVSLMCDRAQMASNKNKGMYDAPFSFYDNSLREKLVQEEFILSHMQAALSERQFQVFYQPKYDLTNELVAGAEALVRWIHPEKGMLSPGTFIPLFERNGFITQLDQYVWETACRNIRGWMDKGYPPVSISVNVSRADIYNPRLAEILVGLLAKYRVPIRYLHLEITESAYTTNPDQIIQVVSRLRQIGFVIEMDDFGSGYSSLNMLAKMPVDILKLDIKFIQNETGRASGKGILSFVISLAKWLNLAVVAEGVETAEQISTLRGMDCNYVQGFYFSKPMPLESFAQLLSTAETTEMICTGQSVREYLSQPPALCHSGRTLLVVDDIELNRAVLVSAFSDLYHVVEAENGRAAWDYLDKHHDQVELVLLDLLMPVMDGYQLLHKIRADARTHTLPVIITSQPDTDSEERALQMQADDFISKPYSQEIIRHRVHNVIASHRLEQLAMQSDESRSTEQQAFDMVQTLKAHFDFVRLVEPAHMLVYHEDISGDCTLRACYCIWGKSARCANCISLRALQDKSRYCKLEYSPSGLYFVISEYVPYGQTGAVVEMVNKLDDEYVDNVFDKKLLYVKLDEIHQQLEQDALTTVYNRRYIDSHLGSYLRRARQAGQTLCIAMVDVDNFKQLNDACGHLAGDEILRSVARALSDNLSASRGDFVARFGGDEFLIVCCNIAPPVFQVRMEQVAKLIALLPVQAAQTQRINISVGCASSDELLDASATALIDLADKRLYAAKKTGGAVVTGPAAERI